MDDKTQYAVVSACVIVVYLMGRRVGFRKAVKLVKATNSCTCN